MNLYVGNLPFNVTEDDLKEKFSEFGEVGNINLIKDSFSGESRGFGFVDLPNNSEADKAIKALNGSQYMGRVITVNQAKPREKNSRGGGRSRY